MIFWRKFIIFASKSSLRLQVDAEQPWIMYQTSMGIVLSILILIAVLFALSSLFKKSFNDAPYWKRLLWVISNKVVDYYCKATPGKIILYALRINSAAYAIATIGYPIVSFISSNGDWSVIFKWNEIDTRSLFIYLIVNCLLAVSFLYYKRYGGDEARKDHKRQEEQHEEQLMLQRKTITEIENFQSFVNKIPVSVRSLIIRNIKDVRNDVEKLHFASALGHLHSLRSQCEEYLPEDNVAMAYIEYWEACCLKYSEPINSVSKFKKAQKLSQSSFISEIIEGYVFALCFEARIIDAKHYVESNREHLNDSPWLYIPEFLDAEDKYSFFQIKNITDQDLIEKILAESILLMQKLNQDIELSKFPIRTEELPLNYDSFPLWALKLSSALSLFLKDCFWGFNNPKLSTDESKLLHQLCAKFINNDAYHEVKAVLPDVELYYAVTGYLNDREGHWIEDIRKQIDRCHHKDFAYLALSFSLYNSGKPHEGIEVLMSYNNRPNELTWNLITMLVMVGDWDRISDLLNDLIKADQTIVPTSGYYILINLVRFFPERFASLARQFTLKDLSYGVYTRFIDFFEGDKSAAQELIKSEGLVPKAFSTVYPHIYKAIGDYSSAIDRAKLLLTPKVIDAMTITYVELLEDSNQLQTLMTFLRDLRSNGVIYVPFLYKELNLSFKAHNHSESVAICNVLYKECPSDSNVAYNLIMSYYHAGKEIPEFDNVYRIVKEGKLGTDHVKNLFNVLLSLGKTKQALDFLYVHVITSKNQSLRDFYYGIHLIPELDPIISESKSIAEIGDYITYTDGSSESHGIIYEDSLLAGFIGKSIGAIVDLDHGIKKVTFTMTMIQSKYAALLNEVTEDIMNNRSGSIRVFNFDDIKDNPLEGLQKIVAAYRGDKDLDYKKEMDHQSDLYVNSQWPLYLVKPISDISALYDMIFGEFSMHQVPFHIIRSRFDEQIDFGGMTYVLDLSAIILMHAISTRFKISHTKHFLISQRTYDYIRENKESIKRHSDQILYSTLVRHNLSHLNDLDSEPKGSMSPILDNLLHWIDVNCNVVVVEEMVDHDDYDFSPIIQTHIESILLSQRPNSILITEDLWLCNMPGLPPKVNVEYFLYSFKSNILPQVSRYLTDLNYYGHLLDGEYIIEQIKLKEKGVPNGYEKVLELIKYNPYILSNFIKASITFSSGIITQARINLMQKIYKTIFESLGYRQSKHVYSQIISFPMPIIIATMLKQAFQELESQQLIIEPSNLISN